MKIKWKVQPAPTGRYRSFERRGWPSGTINDEAVALLRCEHDYTAKLAKGEPTFDGTPPVISVWVADWTAHNTGTRTKNGTAFVWRCLKARFSNVADAKAAAQSFLDSHPNFLPNIPKKESTNEL